MNRILVALDFPSLEEANRQARELIEVVGGFKVGMELLMAAGPTAIEAVASMGKPVFADAKLHDIPNTVRRAATRVEDAGARWVTVHAAGGAEMVAAAVDGMGGAGVLAVTMLTSLSESYLPTIGVESSAADYVLTLARMSTAAGAEGVVCSPAETRVVREAVPGGLIFNPGVRPRGSSSNDQKRVASPEEALANGADYLVIGRPITGADDPVEAARRIATSIASFE